MTTAQSLHAALAWLDDRVNPIIVKEARQAVRAASVTVVLTVLLAVLFIVTAFTVMYEQGTVRAGGGGVALFQILNGIVMGLCLLFVPAYSAVRLSSERAGAAADLLHVTTISPVSIVWGKLAVAMMLSVLFFSMAAPFLMLTYLFRGIDLVTVAFVVAIELIVCLAASQVGVFVASLPITGPLRGIMGLIAIVIAIYLVGAVSVFAFIGGLSVTMFDRDTWWEVATIVFVMLAATGALFCLSVAACSPAPSNRARLPRLYLTLCWIASLAVALALTFLLDWRGALPAWYVTWLILGCAGIWLAIGERRVIGLRIRARLPRSGSRRLLAFPFTSGAASGLAWSAALIAASCIVTVLVLRSNPTKWPRVQAPAPISALASPLWVFVYGLIAARIRDRFLSHRVGTETAVPIAIGLASLSSFLPMIIAFAIWPDSWDRKTWLLLTSVAGPAFLDDPRSGTLSLSIAAAAAFIMILVSLNWFAAQVRAFRPLEPTIGAPDASP